MLTGGEWWHHRFIDVAKWGLKLRVIDREGEAETKSFNLNTEKESVCFEIRKCEVGSIQAITCEHRKT